MRIISKYKDFYDSFGYILGKPDESIIYIRDTKYIKSNDKTYDKVRKILNNYAYYDMGSWRTKEMYNAYVDTIVVGIYPYLYVCPFYIIMNRNIPVYDIKPIPISVNDIKNRDFDSIYNKVNIAFNKFASDNNISNKCLHIFEFRETTIKYGFYRSFDFLHKELKVENKDIFNKIGVPVFVYVDRWSHIFNHIGKYDLILDPVFNQLPFNVMGGNTEEITNDSNIYINIENFLWSIKQEPESKPDNNTKIINAGFDLKTSFRNVK